MTETTSTWLENLSAGDEVVVERWRFSSKTLSVESVVRTTKTRIIVDGDRFRRRDGIGTDGAPGWAVLHQASPDVVAAIEAGEKRRALMERIRTGTTLHALGRLRTYELESIVSLLDTAENRT